MYGIYDDIIAAAKRAVKPLDETAELLEYPEVQADKAYYVSVLNKYNGLKALNDKLSALTTALDGERELSVLLSESGENERQAILDEISACRRRSTTAANELSDALGLKHVSERAYCRFKMSERTSKPGVQMYALVKSYLTSTGSKIFDEKFAYSKDGDVLGISFFVEGEDALTRLTPLAGAHKAYLPGGKSDRLRFAVTPVAGKEEISDDDVKIDLFHSHGAGGQNVNKVETAVRATHVPTGIVVVCQDERSQLKNKERAVETLKRRVEAMQEDAQTKRVEADIRAQFAKEDTPISFDLSSSTMTDARLKSCTQAKFPLADFAMYMNGIIAL